MLHDIVKKGSTDRSVTVRIIDSTDGTPETGVVYNTSGIDLWYRREGAAVVSITEATLAALTTAHADGGFLAISHGYYRLDLPDAAFATGANYVDFGGTVTGMVVIGGRVRLVDYDPEDTVRMGLTALPNAAAEAAGGLYTRGSGAGQINQSNNGQVDANAARTGGTTNTGRDIGASVLLAGVTHTGAVIPTVTTLTGHTAQTGDAYARLGAPAGASVSADVAAVKVDTAATLVDTAEIGAAGAGLTALATAANLATVAGYLDTEIAAILADTNELQTDWANGGRLDLILDALASQTSVDDLPTNAELATSQAAADDATLAAIAALTIPTAAAIADAVWDEAISGHAVSGSTGEALAAAGGAGDPWITALPGSYSAGQAGYIVGTNLNATVSSRASQTSLDTVDDFLDTEIAAIKTKTDFLPSATAGAAGGLFIAGTNAATTITTALTTTFTGDLTGNVGGNVTGSVGSVTGLTAATVHGDLDDIQSRLPAALVSGRMDASVGAMAANVMTAAAAAADLTTELQSGLATASAVSTLQTSVDDLPTNAELATSQAAADDATLAAIAALTIPSAAAIADAVWDEAAAGHVAAGSTGEALGAAGAAGDPWITTLPGAYTAGQAGHTIGSLTFTVAGKVDANIKNVNDVEVNGTGEAGDEWGP